MDPWGLSCKKVNTWNEFQRHHRGNFETSTDAAKAYHNLIKEQSPWPLNEPPSHATIIPGVRIKMAVSPGQPSTRPGGFATFDEIPNKPFVRNELGVKNAWKPDIDRVITYEVVKPLPVKIGTVGPQIDKDAGAYLEGGKSQVEMLVPYDQRMDYLKVIEEKPIGN